MTINSYFIGDYSRLNYHTLLWLLVDIVLVVINGYYISDYWWLFY